MRILLYVLGMMVLAQTCGKEATQIPVDYTERIEAWRTERIEKLTATDSWLSLAGLYWLKPGANAFGSDSANALVFPQKAPGKIGAFYRQKDSVWVEIDPSVRVWDKDSNAVRVQPLTGRDSALTMQHESLSWFLIERGGQFGIRLRDSRHERLTSFTGIDYFPIDPAWRVSARLQPVSPPDTILIRNVVDMQIPLPTEGQLLFELDGRSHAVTVLDGGPEEYFLIFMDATSGKETYPAGRYLYVPKAGEDGTTYIDFNKAYNPPCAFTEFATCLLPPPENRLDLAVRVGEKDYGTH